MGVNWILIFLSFEGKHILSVMIAMFRGLSHIFIEYPFLEQYRARLHRKYGSNLTSNATNQSAARSGLLDCHHLPLVNKFFMYSPPPLVKFLQAKNRFYMPKILK